MQQLIYQVRYALPLWLIGLLSDWWPDNRVTIRLRGGMCRPFFKRCGKRFTCARRVTFLNTPGIEIGENVYVATGAWIDGIGGVTIGDEVKISPYVVIASSSHCFRNGSVAQGGALAAPISVGRGSWIASHAILVGGTRIGNGCLVAGNAVVTRDVPDHMMVGGVPASIVGPVPERVPTHFARFTETAETTEGG